MGTRRQVNVSDIVALPFEWGSALRGKRFFHPLGVLAEGSIERTAPAGEGLPIPSSDVVARVSKATGTPGALPDLIGLAIRVTPSDSTKPWDILLVSAGSGVLSRAVALRPVTSWAGHTLTTLMGLHYRGHNWWLRARIVTGIDGLGLSLDGIRRRIENGGVQVALDQACGRGDFTPLGRLTLTGVLDAERGKDVSFDPVVNTAPGLSLSPAWLANLRGSAYQRSRDGRDAD
jgi:hypothetical protein